MTGGRLPFVSHDSAPPPPIMERPAWPGYPSSWSGTMQVTPAAGLVPCKLPQQLVWYHAVEWGGVDPR